MTVLYVDDEDINLQLFEYSFNGVFNVITALSGEDGLEILRNNNQINAVVSDMRMPGMDGLEFISKIKEEYSQICCYILTGFDITEAIADALKEKIILKYFCKPFDVEEIESALKSCNNE